jgi:murein DD-endopeptidase MepM/ murein hydrolase activator NlpD
MHIQNRLAAVTMWLMLLIPLGTTSAVLFSTDEERAAQEDLQEVLDQVKDASTERATIGAQKRYNERILTDTEKKLLEITKQKREVRLRLSALRSLLMDVQGTSEELIREQAQAAVTMRREEEKLRAFLRYVHVRQTDAPRESYLSSALLRRLFVQSLGEAVDRSLADSALKRARAQLIDLLIQAQQSARLSFDRLSGTAGDLTQEVIPLEKQLASLQSDYFQYLGEADEAVQLAALSDEQLAEVQREEAEVRMQVLKLQAELERIDARIRRKAERDLVDLGLKAPSPGAYTDGRIVGAGDFIWPVKGRISAGFMDTGYYNYFRIAHKAIDIVVPQGTPVVSASTGIVYLARDGGAKGYSYILIGHRGGFATLYGHLSEFAVANGDYVRQGQVIGYSGGRPGTHGAGPMTTGAHLHFEVIMKGVNVDPRTVLPK